MTPEEMKLIELEQAQSNMAAQVTEQGNKKAMQESYATMEAQNQRIREDIQKREYELQRVGMPTQPYQPAYSSPGMTMGERVSRIGEYAGEMGQTAAQSIKTVGSGVVGGLGNMMSDIGAAVRPIFKTDPMPVAIGYGGYHMQRQGLGEGLLTVMGGGQSGQDSMAMENRDVIASDVGERVGVGTMAAASTLGGITASVFASKIPLAGAAGGAIGGALGRMVGMRGALSAIGKFAVPNLILPLAGYELGSKVVDAVQNRRETEGFLEESSFRFIGAGSDMVDPRSGKGAGREERQQISEFLRKSDIEDIMMSGEDMMNILKEGTRFGMFEGAGSDIEKFKKRFTEIKDNVREVAKTLNVSLDEGLATMKELYGAGVDPSRARDISTMAATTGRVAGRTGSEMITLGLQGAEQFRGTGVDMEIGMRGTMMNLTAIRAARDAGTISKAAIEQAGGEEALAMRRTQRQVQFSQSEEGRSYMASFFDPSTGGLNMRSFEKAMGGDDVSIADLATQAAANLNDPSKLIKFESQQEQIASEMGKAFGGRGLQFGQWNLAMAEAKMMSDATGASREDSFRSIMLRKGISPQELEAMQGEAAAAQDVFGASQKGAQKERDRLAAEEAERNTLLTRIAGKLEVVADKLIDTVAKPMNSFVNEIAKGFETLSDTMSGLERSNVSTVATGAKGGISGGTMVSGSAEAQEVKNKIYGADAATRSDEVRKVLESTKGPLDLSGGGGLFRSGAGENLEELISGGGLGESFKADLVTTSNKADLAVLTSKDISGFSGRSGRDRGATYTGLTKAGAARLESLGRVLGMTDDDLKTLEDKGRLKDKIGGESINAAIGELSSLRKLDASKGIDVAINQILEEMNVKGPDGKTPATLETLTLDQSASIVQKLREQPEFKESFSKSREAWTQYQTGREVGRSRVMKDISEGYEAVREEISDKYRGMELSDTGLANLGRAQSLRVDASREKDPEKKAALEKQAKDLINETYAEEQKKYTPEQRQRVGMTEFFGVLKDYAPKTAAEMKATESELAKLQALEAPTNEQTKRRLLLQGEVRGFQQTEMLTRLGAMSRGLVQFQGAEAKETFGEMIYSEMITNKDLTADDVKASKNLISDIIDNPLMISKLTKTQQETLSKTKIGQVFKDRGADVIELKNEMTAAGGDVGEQRAAFDKAFGSMSEEYFKQYQGDKNLERIISSSFESTVAATVGTEKAASGGSSGDTSMKNSIELFRVMTAANWTVLGALQSLHNKIKD